ncbi:MAG: gliding motility-associated protein GldE [Bacteroidales bacterium]|nr:gliding motility-associated protein GldE [Bacteroidales bacterium]
MDPDHLSQPLLTAIQLQTPSLSAIIAIILALLLLCASGFISASEIAFFSLSPLDRSRLDEKEHPSDQIINDLLSRSQFLLATILIANNFVNVAVVILCTFFMNAIFLEIPAVISFIFQTVILTFLLLLFGEIMPKIYASSNALKFARFSASVLSTLQKFFYPLASLLVITTDVINKRFSSKNENISMDDLSQALALTSHEIKEEKNMLEEIIKFGDKTALEAMTSRVEMTAVEITADYESVMKLVVDTNYSRIPVFENTEDHIKGILYIKDLLPYLDRPDNFDWQTLIRPAYFVPETKKIDDLLEDFRSKKIHVAIVVDEFGGTSGLITLEDVLEEIIGEISDEYDDDELYFQKLSDNTWIFEGRTPLNDFYKETDLDDEAFENKGEVCETLAGLILEIKGDFPKSNEVLTYKNFRLTILSMDKRRIQKIRFTIVPSGE